MNEVLIMLVKKGVIFLIVFITYSKSLGQVQESLFEKSSYLIDNKVFRDNISLEDTTNFKLIVEPIILPKFSTFWLKFHLDIHPQQDSTVFINCNNQGFVHLFQINHQSLKTIGEAGFVCPFYRRSIRDDISTIRLVLRKGESRDFLLQIKNFTIEDNRLAVNIYDSGKISEINIAKNDNFVNKYGQPIFLGIVLLILIITLIQCLLLQEKIYFFYLFYIILVLLRVAMGISLLVIEDFFPVLRSVGFISRFSQSCSFLSIICYLFFIREFANIPLKAPRLNKLIKFQILFMSIFFVAELFMVVEKYTIPRYIAIFSGFEFVEAVLAILTTIGLFRLYDKQNKYLIWGVSFLFIGAFGGQQLVGKLSNLSRMEQDVYLQISWGIAYLGEMIFFTIGLFNRSLIMKEVIKKQALENKQLLEELENRRKRDVTIQPETLSITTTKGKTIIQQSDIYRIEASGNYTIFHIHNQKPVIASYSMADFENKLNTEKFLRVHKSHIINLQYIGKYTRGDGGSLTLHDGTEIPVSRSRKEELIKILFTDN